MAPSPTKAPTLTANQEGELAIGLLKNNANCRLPCWWGFAPGKTAWQTARTFFESLGKVPAEYRDTNMLNYSVDFRIPKHDVAIGQIYIVENGSIDAIWVSSGTVRDHETIYGDSHFAEDWQRYFLPQLLATYGQPSQILVRTFRSAPEAFIPFNLLLFYPKQGILVWYYGPTTRRGERIRICPQQSDITLALWPPEQELTLGNIASWGLGLPIEEVLEFRPLEEATGINMETFYQTFKNANNPACFETPVGLWSH